MPRCRWDRGCEQDRYFESGEYCYYHFKLVTGQVSPAEPSKRPPLADDLERAGAPEEVFQGVDDKPEALPRTKEQRRRGFIRTGILRTPKHP